MDQVELGFKFRHTITNSEYYISKVWRRRLLDISSPLLVTISDSHDNKIVSCDVRSVLNEIEKGRYIPI